MGAGRGCGLDRGAVQSELRAAVERGLWLRAHAYHPGHRTVLMKYPLVIERCVIAFVIEQLRGLCREMPWR